MVYDWRGERQLGFSVLGLVEWCEMWHWLGSDWNLELGALELGALELGTWDLELGIWYQQRGKGKR